VNGSFISSSYYIEKLSNNIDTLRLFCVNINKIHVSKIIMEMTDSFLIIIDCR